MKKQSCDEKEEEKSDCCSEVDGEIKIGNYIQSLLFVCLF